MRTVSLALALLTVPACIVIEPDASLHIPCCTAGDGGTLKTLSVVEDGSSIAMSFTDADGPLACALSEDDELDLGYAGQQLFLRVDPSFFMGCPEGVYALGGSQCGPGAGVPEGCARVRAWASDGRMTVEAWAVSGAVIVEDDFGRCRFDIEAVLPGGEVITGQAKTEDLDFWGEDAVCNG